VLRTDVKTDEPAHARSLNLDEVLTSAEHDAVEAEKNVRHPVS
jgi:hypothetical protein